MFINNRLDNFKKQKYYSKYRIVSWKIVGKLRFKGRLINQKPKWRFLRYSLLNVKNFWKKRKKFLGLKSYFKSREDFRIKSRQSCLKKTYRDSLTEVRRVRLFFGFIKIKVLKNIVIKYSKFKRAREKALINCLESRLDVLVYRMRFSSSVLESSKKIKRGYIYVNGTRVITRNSILNSGDKIKLVFRSKNEKYFSVISTIQNKIPSNLEMNYKNLEGILIRKPLKKELMYPEVFCFNSSLKRLEK
jgi:small subunit ribosomal protein S4